MTPFAGRREGRHPVLYVVTRNNMLSDHGPGDAAGGPRPGAVLARRRLARGGDGRPPLDVRRLRAGGEAGRPRAGRGRAGSKRIPDPRRFAYLEACARVRDARLALEVGFAGANGGLRLAGLRRRRRRLPRRSERLLPGGGGAAAGRGGGRRPRVRLRAHTRPPRRDEPRPAAGFRLRPGRARQPPLRPRARRPAGAEPLQLDGRGRPGARRSGPRAPGSLTSERRDGLPGLTGYDTSRILSTARLAGVVMATRRLSSPLPWPARSRRYPSTPRPRPSGARASPWVRSRATRSPRSLTAAATGSRIAWAFNERGLRNLYVAEAPAWTARRLTRLRRRDDGQELTSLAFSADGRYVVYVRGGRPRLQLGRRACR